MLGKHGLRKRKEILIFVYDYDVIDAIKFYSDDKYKNYVYEFYLNKINKLREYFKDSKLIDSKTYFISARQEAVFDNCYKYYVLNTFKEHDKIYYSYKEMADFIDDYGVEHNGFSNIEIEMLNIMLDFLESKIYLFKDSTNIEFIENDKNIINNYINYEYKVNQFDKDIKLRKIQVEI